MHVYCLIIADLKPKVASGVIPGLPAYVLFMCVRHTDYINDDEKVRSLLTTSINSIRKCVKKHHGDLDRVTLWLANTCRFLHTLKQYGGEKVNKLLELKKKMYLLDTISIRIRHSRHQDTDALRSRSVKNNQEI